MWSRAYKAKATQRTPITAVDAAPTRKEEREMPADDGGAVGSEVPVTFDDGETVAPEL